MVFQNPFKRPWSFIFLGGIALTVLMAAVWFGRGPYRSHREGQLAQQAEQYFKTGDFRNAVLSSRQALQLNPTNLTAGRIMADLAEATHSPAAMEWRRKIAQQNPTIENRLALAAASLRHESLPFPTARQTLMDLENRSETNRADYHAIAAELALKNNLWADAVAHLTLASGFAPTNGLLQFNLAALQLLATNPATYTQATNTLVGMIDDGQYGAQSLRSLIENEKRRKNYPLAKSYSEKLLTSPKMIFQDRIIGMDLQKLTDDPRYESERETLKQLASTNSLAILGLANWLQENGLWQEKIQWLTNLPTKVVEQTPIRISLSDAYIATKNWSGLRDLTAKGDWAETDFLRLALASRAWLELGVSAIGKSSWNAAINRAGHNPIALSTLLRIADSWQWATERDELLKQLCHQFPKDRANLRQLELTLYRQGKTTELREHYAMILKEFPDDAGVKNNLAATSLLLKTNLSQSLLLAESAYLKQTNNPYFISTYAYASCLQGQPQKGLDLMDGMDITTLKSPDIALYHSLVLFANGRISEAKTSIEPTRSNQNLLPEEKELIRQITGE